VFNGYIIVVYRFRCFFVCNSAYMYIFARIIDVSLGTIRIIYLSKGLKLLAPIVGFLRHWYGFLL